MKTVDYIRSVAKAVGGGLAAALGSLLLVVSGDATLADVTTAEWLLVGLNVLGAYGIVYAVPNRQV